MVPLEKYKVPVAPFRALTLKYLNESRMDMKSFSARCGYGESTLRKRLAQDKMPFDLADLVVQRSYGPDIWRIPFFAEILWQGQVPPDLAKPVKCMNITCEEWFALPEEDGPARSGVWKKRYCSQACRQQVWDRNRHGSFERECVGCGEMFTVSPPPVDKRTHGGWARRQYCTPTCQNQTKWKRQKEALCSR